MLMDLSKIEAEVAQLEAKLLAHTENEGDECPLCQLEAENEQLKEWCDIENSYAHMFLVWMRLVKEHSEELYWVLFDKACAHFDALLTE